MAVHVFLSLRFKLPLLCLILKNKKPENQQPPLLLEGELLPAVIIKQIVSKWNIGLRDVRGRRLLEVHCVHLHDNSNVFYLEKQGQSVHIYARTRCYEYWKSGFRIFKRGCSNALYLKLEATIKTRNLWQSDGQQRVFWHAANGIDVN